MLTKTVLISPLALLLLSGCSLNWPGSADNGSQNAGEQEVEQTAVGGSQSNSSFYISPRSPQAGQILKSPFLVGGEAALPGDAVYIRVKNSRGDVLIAESAKIKTAPDSGLAGGPFSILINFHFQSTDAGLVEIYGRQPGAEEILTQTVPVRFDVAGNAGGQF